MLPAILLIATALAADAQTYRTCQVSAGFIHTCEATGYNGTAPVCLSSRCTTAEIRVGKVFTTGAAFNGTVVLDRGTNDKLVQCEIKAGQVWTCSATGFTGEAVLAR